MLMVSTDIQLLLPFSYDLPKQRTSLSSFLYGAGRSFLQQWAYGLTPSDLSPDASVSWAERVVTCPENVTANFLRQSKVVGDGTNVFKGNLLRARSLKREVLDGGRGDSDDFIGGRAETDHNPSQQDEALCLNPRAQLS